MLASQCSRNFEKRRATYKIHFSTQKNDKSRLTSQTGENCAGLLQDTAHEYLQRLHLDHAESKEYNTASTCIAWFLLKRMVVTTEIHIP